MSRRYDPRRAKINRTYSVKELAKLYSVGVTTISAWVSDGLKPGDGRRPYLFRGADVKAYIERRILESKRPCRSGEIFCIACKVPRVPAGGKVVLQPVCSKSANLIGCCPDCSRKIYRRVSMPALKLALGNLNIRDEDKHGNINGVTSHLYSQNRPANG